MRFGNTAFREFCKKMYPINQAFVAKLLKTISLESFKTSLKKMEEQGQVLSFSSDKVEEVITHELQTYLDECYGNEVQFSRIKLTEGSNRLRNRPRTLLRSVHVLPFETAVHQATGIRTGSETHFLRVYPVHPRSANAVQLGTGGVPRRVGTGRLPLHSFPSWKCRIGWFSPQTVRF